MIPARVAIATCRDMPEIDPDDAPLIAPLAERGVEVTPAVWDDPSVDWSAFDLTIIRSTWDYPRRWTEFLAWTRRVPRLANPAEVVEWNTDKRYLDALAAAGAPAVQTVWAPPGEPWRPPADGEWVVKPSVSVGSIDTGRYDMADPEQRDLAGRLAARLHDAGRTVMIQPYLTAVDQHGETALLFFGGRYSHAIRKGAMLGGPYQGVPSLYKREHIRPRQPSLAERETAEKSLAAVPFPADRLLYARVDLIRGPDGPVLVELELTEPSVFLRHDAGAAERFAEAVCARLGIA